jgi:hypothetical protein
MFPPVYGFFYLLIHTVFWPPVNLFEKPGGITGQKVWITGRSLHNSHEVMSLQDSQTDTSGIAYHDGKSNINRR